MNGWRFVPLGSAILLTVLVVLTLGGGIIFTPIATAMTVAALLRARAETVVDFGALIAGAAAVAFYTLIFVWTVGLVLYEVLISG